MMIHIPTRPHVLMNIHIIPHVLIDIVQAHLCMYIYVLMHMDLHKHNETYHTPRTY